MPVATPRTVAHLIARILFVVLSGLITTRILSAAPVDSTPPQIRAAATRIPMHLRFTALDGRTIDLEQLRGKVVLLDFSAYTWCEVCRRTEPFLIAAYQKYHDLGFEVVGFALEFNKGDTAAVAKYVKAHGIPWPLLFSDRDMNEEHTVRLGIRSLPQWLVLDQRGLLVSSNARGPVGEVLEPMIRKLLGLSPLPGQPMASFVLDTMTTAQKLAQLQLQSDPPSLDLARKLIVAQQAIDAVQRAQPTLKLNRTALDGNLATQLAGVPEIRVALQKLGLTPERYVQDQNRILEAWKRAKLFRVLTQRGIPEKEQASFATDLPPVPRTDIDFINANASALRTIGIAEPPEPAMQIKFNTGP